MTDLDERLSRLGLAQYTQKLKDEGFETWETLLDITESDLDALGVKLGHRRILQKEIAHVRGLSIKQLRSPTGLRPLGDVRGEDHALDIESSTGVGGKRKYRRHPKPDENAPERAPSAYVIFSNRIREELKPENLTFTAIAKRVGERWQDLTAEEKEPFELEASSAKERYHTEMAEYKTTRSYREYQQYLVEFKAKNSSTSEGKRPKLVQEESTASSGSLGSTSQNEGQDPPSASVDTRRQRFESISSVGPYSSTSGLPSPTSVAGGTPVLRTGISSILPLGTATSSSSSPSTPAFRRESTTSSSLLGTGQARQSIETFPERTLPSGPKQHLPRIVPPDHRENQAAHISASGPFSEERLLRGRSSPGEQPRRSNRSLAQLQHNNSDSSSKSSVNSTLSSASTAPSSIFSTAPLDEEKKAAMALPPLVNMAASPAGSSSYFDPTLRRNLPLLASRPPSSFGQQQSPSSPFAASSSSGMPFDSLQLPLPYNIQFGRQPSRQPQYEAKLANIFDLQDIPRERRSLRNLALDKEDSTATTNGRSLPEPWHPPHQPNLLALPSMSRDETQEPPLRPDADPLSVLAYAGRMLGRENRPPP